MNTKTETILAWVANGLSIIYLVLTCLSLTVMKSDNNQQYNDMIKQMYGNDQNITSDILFASMVISIGFLAFSTVLGIFGALTIKGRKNLAGGLLIAAAITGIITMNLIAMILWIIAAIMLFNKKKDRNKERHYDDYKQRKTNSLDNEDHGNNQSRENQWDPERELNNRKKDDPYIY